MSANQIDQISIGAITITTIDADPTIAGFPAALGSFAQYTSGTNVVSFYMKTGAADTAWTIDDLGLINLTSQVAGILPNANGGTGLDTSAAANGKLLIGNGSGLSLANVIAGQNITITNGPGSLTIATTESSVITTDTVSTTDATATTISTVATTTDTNMFIESTILARRTGGSSGQGAVGDAAAFKRSVTVRNVGGTVTIRNTQSPYTFQDDLLWGGVSFSVSGTNILIKVTGKANANIDWKNSDMVLKEA